MALFEFELAPVEDIRPWGEPGDQSLSWFALSYGQFRIVVGEQVLLRYTDEILSYWNELERDADYEVGAFARDVLNCVAPAVAPLPPRIERLVSDWRLLTELEKIEDVESADDLYDAWRWLGERSPWFSYLMEYPRFQFVRVGTELRIHWDNRERKIDGIPVWTAQEGVHAMSVDAFQDECRDFVKRLISEMHDRIAGIEAGMMKPQVEVSISSLQEQHEHWSKEFGACFHEYRIDVPWQKTEKALQTIAEKKGIYF